MPSHSAAISGGTSAYIAILLLPLLAHYGISLSIEQQAAFTGLVTGLISYLPTVMAWLFPGKPSLAIPEIVPDIPLKPASGGQPNA